MIKQRKDKKLFFSSYCVLSFFGQNRFRRRNYQQYVQKEAALGRRPELLGGGSNSTSIYSIWFRQLCYQMCTVVKTVIRNNGYGSYKGQF
jgi:hypothetical protein